MFFLKDRFKNNVNIEIVNKAVSDNVGSSIFYEFSDGDAYNTLSEKWVDELTAQDKFRDNVPTQNITSKTLVETVTIDSLVEHFGMPDYIKIDVEGHEKNVIDGMSIIPSMISIECNLPIFVNESIFCIEKLSSLSEKYRFNFSISEPPEVLVLDEWCCCNTILEIVRSKKYQFMEIFAKLC